MTYLSTRLHVLPAAFQTASRPLTFKLASTTVFVAMLLSAYGSRSEAQVAVGAILASEQRGVLTTPTNQDAAPLVNATVVLHAAANAGPPGSGPDGRLIGGPAALANTIPTQFKPPFTTREGLIPFKIIRRDRPARLAYTPVPKLINPLVGPPLPMFTGIAVSANNNGANAQAEAQATFRRGVPNKRGTPTISKTDNSFARLDPAPKGAKPRNADPWEAGALVLDPLTFLGHNGDFIYTDLTLNAGTSANLQSPEEIDGFIFEGGSTVPGLSPGSVGVDYNGDPLFYSLSITFDQQDSSPMVSLMTDRTVGNFYDPITGSLLSDQDIIYAATNAFTFNGPGSWTVNTTRLLFEYISNPLSGLPEEGKLINLDLNAGVGAAAVPEPCSIALLAGMGLVGSVVAALRKWR